VTAYEQRREVANRVLRELDDVPTGTLRIVVDLLRVKVELSARTRWPLPEPEQDVQGLRRTAPVVGVQCAERCRLPSPSV
jgi:hypothetical protein